MSGLLVVAGSDLSMSDLDGGAISARIDLNLNLAPPWSPDFLGLGSGSGEDLRVDENQGHSSRRILPRFGPGIHGVFLDLHHDQESQPDQSAFAQVRGISSISSSPSHEQVIPSIRSMQTQSVHARNPVPTQAYSQETVEQLHEGFYEQTEAGNVLPFGQESLENYLIRPPTRHGFRRYMRPVAGVEVERLEFTPTRLEETVDIGSPMARLVDSTKDFDTKEGSSNAGKEVETSSAGSFDCNVCLDMAVEPVLTSCGHLFCWPCLYKWLYIHSEDEECPVCKGAVAESDIIPIYGRGCKTTSVSQSAAANESDLVPPRPHARRTESLRQRLGSWISSWEWERERMGEVEREDSRGFMWRSNEVLRMRRAFHFLQENVEGTLHTRVRTRRRMAERRERFRAPAVEGTSNGPLHHTRGGIHDVLHRRVARRLSEHLQDDVVRRLARNRTQTEDRLALIRARFLNLTGSEDSQRAVSAAISGQDGFNIPSVTSNFSSAQIAHGPSGISIPEETTFVHVADTRRQIYDETRDQFSGRERVGISMTQTGEAHSIRPSGYADVEAESSHGRKRRRLN
ncbi:hypothetical protein O6H91_07G118800 [Diphasiastrum complanatum]|uniref:Uncharacterized protein n=1 Tax=Diphasiastrum complanatum TaxID=34168 RepID=A0ACC2D8X7_DIPCM|nr:hypothetical protein O6H91_07G118800 [Diphasiastrum complanatum]